MDSDGGNARILTDRLSPDESPSWSPDGRQIAYTSHLQNGNREIYVMDSDGDNPTNLTDDRANDRSPSWSQDGLEIAFQSNRDGNSEIYVMDADGRHLRNLTNDPSSDTTPTCSDPALLSVSPAGARLWTWGWIKESGSELR
jgi:Tol biopolymer transport system component